MPSVDVIEVPLEAILEMRDAYRCEMHCQIVHDSWHTRGFTRLYLLRLDGVTAGYGAIGGAPRDPKETLKEFYVTPEHRAEALPLFRRLVDVGGARVVEAQTNDRLLSLMLYDTATEITAEKILFADAITTDWPKPQGISLRRVTAEADGGNWALQADGEIVATGGILYHYNPPYGDVFMEVAEGHRRRGLGTYLVQELKRICREGGHVPAARCQHDNYASRRTLERAGMLPCGRILRGRLPASEASPSEAPKALSPSEP